MNREAAEIALMERAGQEERLIRMMWLVVGVVGFGTLGIIATIYITSGNADMLAQLLTAAGTAAAPVG